MKNINVKKGSMFAFVFSSLFIVVGIILFIVLGFNAGIDFSSGYSERITIAPLGMTVSYNGDGSAKLTLSGNTLSLEIYTKDGFENVKLAPSIYKSVDELASEMRKHDLDVKVYNKDAESERIVSSYAFPYTLSPSPIRLNFSSSTNDITTEDVRKVLSEEKGVKVQRIGGKGEDSFQVRALLLEGEDQTDAKERIERKLYSYFGEENVVTNEATFVGPKFSSSLLFNSILAIIIALVLILVYIAIRFKLSYAISAIIALFHDVLMMLSFIVIFRIEVSSVTIAAVLTIIGYSLNNTIVIFDRVRENIKNNLEEKKKDRIDIVSIVNGSVKDSLSRTIITTLTTLLAIIPLAIFSSGEIKLFAINLIWGLLIGAYSSMFIAPGFLLIFHKVFRIDKEKKKSNEEYRLV